DPPEGPSASVVGSTLADGSRAEAVERLRGAGVPATACVAFQELFSDPLLRGTGRIVEQVHPALGTLLVPAPFIRCDGASAPLGRPSPALGADGPDVLAEMGYTAEDIVALGVAGVVG